MPPVVIGIAMSTKRGSALCSHISSQAAEFHSGLSNLGHKLGLEKGCTNWLRLCPSSVLRKKIGPPPDSASENHGLLERGKREMGSGESLNLIPI